MLMLKTKKEHNEINMPVHYTSSKVECKDYIRDSMGDEAYTGFCLGNVVKYIHRHKLKGTPKKDLEKARFYLDEVIKML